MFTPKLCNHMMVLKQRRSQSDLLLYLQDRVLPPIHHRILVATTHSTPVKTFLVTVVYVFNTRHVLLYIYNSFTFELDIMWSQTWWMSGLVMKEQVLEWHTFRATGRYSLVWCKLTLRSIAGNQHVSGGVQVAIVDLRLDAQDVTHQGVDVDRLKRPHLQVPVKSWTHSPEERLHVHVFVVVAVLPLVELNWKVLQAHRGMKMHSLHHPPPWIQLLVLPSSNYLICSSHLLVCSYLVSRGWYWPSQRVVFRL